MHFLGLFQKRWKSHNLANHCRSEQCVGLAGSEYGHSSPSNPTSQPWNITGFSQSQSCCMQMKLSSRARQSILSKQIWPEGEELTRCLRLPSSFAYKIAGKQISRRNKVIKHTPGASFLWSVFDICAVLRCIREIISLSQPRHRRQEKELMNIDFMKWLCAFHYSGNELLKRRHPAAAPSW